nr:RNA-binding motif protein, X-linked 2-like [Lytechinus pictus]
MSTSEKYLDNTGLDQAGVVNTYLVVASSNSCYVPVRAEIPAKIMNPLTNVKNINKLNELEAEFGVSSSASWHQQYKDSAYIFIGGLPFELTEGDVLCVFSQYGEIVNINLVRDKKTGKSKGYCFIAYEDQRSTILAVDNFNGIKLKGRTLRVDHVNEYRKPKDDDDIDDATKKLREEGCAPKTPPTSNGEEEEEYQVLPMKDGDRQSVKKKSKKEKKKKKRTRDHDDKASTPPRKVKMEEDEDYGRKKEKKYDP